jgi:hypothetical protein
VSAAAPVRRLEGNLKRVLALNGIFEILDALTEAALVSNG